ncbi:urea amidolyase [Marivita sp. S6314]|uniref:5-oxoprolinase subunit C family protein n=1 Tax=Marivita sp. S6314 TaxID=2926406 RepID=UPI001FF4F688|nr:urea amidolyase [Marivita sp. S6314]MCK0149055.1 urea amidolyase [Marivita sp. S6314]
MTRALIVHRIVPGATVQDMGRTGFLAFGLSRGGAADRLALAEGAALLGQLPSSAALELPGSGGVFEATAPLRIALTGAPMRVTLDGETLAWNASHMLPQGAMLEIGAVTSGSYGYLHVGGGFATQTRLGAQSAHLAAGVGQPVVAGDHVPVGPDAKTEVGLTLPVDPRFSGGVLRVMESFQSDVFDADTRLRFGQTAFHRDARANRMGIRLNSDGDGFFAKGGLNILSETIVPGDIQVTGDGAPYLLLSESQTTGGYPRIGTVIPADLSRAVQTPPGGSITFDWVSRADALIAQERMQAYLAQLPKAVTPLIRDPAQIRDLLSYQLISGATAGHIEEQEP